MKYPRFTYNKEWEEWEKLTESYKGQKRKTEICIRSCRAVCTWWGSDGSKIKPQYGWWHKKWAFYSHSIHRQAPHRAPSITVWFHPTPQETRSICCPQISLVFHFTRSINDSLLVSCNASAFDDLTCFHFQNSQDMSIAGIFLNLCFVLFVLDFTMPVKYCKCKCIVWQSRQNLEHWNMQCALERHEETSLWPCKSR